MAQEIDGLANYQHLLLVTWEKLPIRNGTLRRINCMDVTTRRKGLAVEICFVYYVKNK